MEQQKKRTCPRCNSEGVCTTSSREFQESHVRCHECGLELNVPVDEITAEKMWDLIEESNCADIYKDN